MRRPYKLNPLYWLSRYFGFGLYALRKDIEYINKLISQGEQKEKA